MQSIPPRGKWRRKSLKVRLLAPSLVTRENGSLSSAPSSIITTPAVSSTLEQTSTRSDQGQYISKRFHLIKRSMSHLASTSIIATSPLQSTLQQITTESNQGSLMPRALSGKKLSRCSCSFYFSCNLSSELNHGANKHTIWSRSVLLEKCPPYQVIHLSYSINIHYQHPSSELNHGTNKHAIRSRSVHVETFPS